jgi:hypothetical protein
VPVHGDNAVSTIEFDIKSTIDAAKTQGTVLTLGYNTGFLAIYLRIKKIKNIINMDGVEWKRQKYSFLEKIYLWINERLAARFGSKLIADHPEIANHLTRHTSATKIAMIPYGSERIYSSDSNILQEFGVECKRYFTLIARPEPENSIIEIVRAFSCKRRGVKLLVLGNYRSDNAYHSSVIKAASDEVIFAGAVYDTEKIRAIRYFSLAYIHGHQVGGTNPSLVEALGAGNAIIAHDNKFNRWVASDAALYFSSEDECSDNIDKILQDDDFCLSLQKSAIDNWSNKFQWPLILSEYECLLKN